MPESEKTVALAPRLLWRVVTNRREELLLTVMLMLTLMVFSSVVIHFLERAAQPEAFANVFSAMWWAVAALTTVGYGDIYPVTVAGKVFAAVMAMCGVGMFALPAGILGGGFVEEIEASRQERRDLDNARLVREAFEVEHLIRVTRLKRKLGIATLRKQVELVTLCNQLGLPSEVVVRAVAAAPDLRLRNIHSSAASQFEDLVVVERFGADRPYGTCLERSGDIVVVNSTAVAEPAVGHFSEALASLLDATYVANERFHSAALRKSRRANFSASVAYVDESAEVGPELRAFRHDIGRVARSDRLVILFFSAARTRPDVTLATGGHAGELCYRHDTPTLDDLARVESFVGTVGPKLKDELGLTLSDEIPVNDVDPKRLCQFIRRTTGADVVTIRVNIKTLRWADEEEYYGLIAALADGIRGPLRGRNSGSSG